MPRGSWNQEIADVLLRNDGGIFEDVAQEAGLPQVVRTSNAIWLDFDRDGRDDAGQQVLPGIYLYHISMDVDQKKIQKVGVLPVVY